jgi:hypothetical protein
MGYYNGGKKDGKRKGHRNPLCAVWGMGPEMSFETIKKELLILQDTLRVVKTDWDRYPMILEDQRMLRKERTFGTAKYIDTPQAQEDIFRWFSTFIMVGLNALLGDKRKDVISIPNVLHRMKGMEEKDVKAHFHQFFKADKNVSENVQTRLYEETWRSLLKGERSLKMRLKLDLDSCQDFQRSKLAYVRNRIMAHHGRVLEKGRLQFGKNDWDVEVANDIQIADEIVKRYHTIFAGPDRAYLP